MVHAQRYNVSELVFFCFVFRRYLLEGRERGGLFWVAVKSLVLRLFLRCVLLMVFFYGLEIRLFIIMVTRPRRIKRDGMCIFVMFILLSFLLGFACMCITFHTSIGMFI